MSSTGEVGCLGSDLHEALLHGLLATGFRFPQKGVLLSLGPRVDKYWFFDETRVIAEELRLPIYATRGTAEMLLELGVSCTLVEKQPGQEGTSAMDIIDAGLVDLVINIPRDYDQYGRPDGYHIRRCAVDAGVPLITDLHLARAVIEALRRKQPHSLEIKAWNDYQASDSPMESMQSRRNILPSAARVKS
jgi:carbamoyl-phosphate synthase large subunit